MEHVITSSIECYIQQRISEATVEIRQELAALKGRRCDQCEMWTPLSTEYPHGTCVVAGIHNADFYCKYWEVKER